MQAVAVAQVQHARLVRDRGELVAPTPGRLHLRELALRNHSPSSCVLINQERDVHNTSAAIHAKHMHASVPVMQLVVSHCTHSTLSRKVLKHCLAVALLYDL